MAFTLSLLSDLVYVGLHSQGIMKLSYRGRAHHPGHLVLDWSLENLHMNHLALCLCCPLSLHFHYYWQVEFLEGRKEQSEVGLVLSHDLLPYPETHFESRTSCVVSEP